jgi:putative addiction module killer protein
MQIRRTEEFAKWLRDLKDLRGRAKIFDRLDRLADGNPGNARSVGAGVVELKIDYGPGYRVYYVERGKLLILLLCGGDKSTQDKDIQRAKVLAGQPINMEGEGNA